MLSDSHIFSKNSRQSLNKLQRVVGLITYIIYAFCQPAFAQLCVNPSGQLVIDQSFGTASQPVQLDGMTPYQYIPPTCPSDGQYTLTETIDGSCFNYTWYAVTMDHTPDDVDGNMMIVNGANKAGVFYQQSVSGLCAGTSYEISLWVLNLLKTGICPTPLKPNLSVRIETKGGHVLGSAMIGIIEQADEPIWRQYSALFTAPQTTEELIIKLINNEGDYGCGNDIVIDDIQIRQCDECSSKQIYVPDVFTPNNDGLNDDLVFFMPKVSSYDLKVYDRWGSVIFTSNNVNQKWDGSYAGNPCTAGEYTWMISYRPTQATQEQREQVQTGHVLLMR
ncbi:T9SS type B sorting domain-containing protein [Spirosoma flavum]|uniref:Gliding motility-associated C-terminal domain-containing protein n=1 Tax=Spirosoma flavum TaxID=2048557 RepID=A0ABW6AHK9_9BACT